MPPILVRLNLPGFSSPEPFRLANAQPSLAGLACAVLEEIGGFSKEELEGVRNNLDRVPLTLLGELCAGQLVELGSDAQLEVFLASAGSPRGPAIIEVRPRDVTPQVSSATALTREAQADGGGCCIHANGSNVTPAKHVAAPPSGAGFQHDQAVHSAQCPSGEQALTQVQSSSVGGACSHCEVVPAVEKKPDSSPEHAPQPTPEAASQVAAEGHHVNGHVASATACMSSSWPSPISPTQVSGTHASHHAQSSSFIPAPVVNSRAASPDRSTLIGERHATASSSNAAPPGHDSTRQTKGTRTRGHSDTLDGNHHTAGRRSQSAASTRRNAESASPLQTGQPSDGRCGSTFVQDRRASTEIFNRLYNEKDERRRRKEELRLRQLEQQDEEIRLSAQRAMGRVGTDPIRGSPEVRAISPSRTAPSAASAVRSSPQTRPPLPDRHTTGHEARERQRAPPVPSSGPCPATSSSSRRNQMPQHQPQQQQPHHAPSYEATQSTLSAVPADASSIMSDSKPSQTGGLTHIPSVGSFIAEESYCADRVAVTASVEGDDGCLQKIVRAQQQRIEFLEGVHQQALRQLRKTREELSVAQQMRLREADKVLQLEQLVSEMQAQRFEGDPQSQRRWEEWLNRSRAILESD
mmetsp:Transcript_43686/g.100827  ORF Transcript_43686/g.100827 Transcript_43686/m.100827 type:complete len:637 (-) Transcript_43686:48-1958(-)